MNVGRVRKTRLVAGLGVVALYAWIGWMIHRTGFSLGQFWTWPIVLGVVLFLGCAVYRGPGEELVQTDPASVEDRLDQLAELETAIRQQEEPGPAPAPWN